MMRTSGISRQIRNILIFLIAAGAFASGLCGNVTLTITGNGSPGPYSLGTWYVDSASITVKNADSGYVPSFTYVGSVNGLLFSDPVDSGIVLSVSFSILYAGLPKIYSVYPKHYRQPDDTMTDTVLTTRAGGGTGTGEDNLTVSGYKSFGVSVGSFGQVNLEQGLDVRIGGEIRPGTEVSAHLNDQGTSLDGATREISEFDRIYVTLTDPHFRIVAGDQYVQWPVSGILEGRKKIKGIAVALHPGNIESETFGALAGGKFTVQTWRGDKGQGPYALTGNGEPGFIMPVSGTVHLTINGRTCSEGADKDFLVDYELGTVTFTALQLVNPEDIVRTEYEYKTFDYQRTLAGTSLSAGFGDSLLTVKSALWTESDNRNSPIDLVLTDKNIRTLRESGDRPPMDTAIFLVNKNDVLDRYASVPLYSRVDSAGTVIFVHRIPDPSNVLNNDSLYDVHFTRSDSCADYVRILDNNEFVYRYAGHCAGDYSPLTPLRAPSRRTSGEVVTRLDTRLFRVTADVAGQEHDRNLFSTRDDGDNLSSAVHTTMLVGHRSTTEKALWLDGSLQYFSARFDREGLSAEDRKTAWNDTALNEGSNARTLWETSAGWTPASFMTTNLTYGQQRNDGQLQTDKSGGEVFCRPLPWLTGAWDGNYFRHFEQRGTGSGHRQQATVSADFPHHTARFSAHDEWRRDYESTGGGLLEGMLSYLFHPLRLEEEATWTVFRSGNRGLYSAVDTADAFAWMQKIDCSPLSSWRVNGNSTWQLRRSLADSSRGRSTTLLIDMTSETGGFSSPFSTRQHYRTTAERASRYLQIPTYVGEGRGTHVWDSTLHEYTEDPRGNGDFIIRQTDILDSTNTNRTRKTVLDGAWSYRPPEKKFSGILADLVWEGTLSLEEHVDAALLTPSSWLPGYQSLRALLADSTGWKNIRYGDLSYQQEISWKPSFNRSLEARLSLRPEFSFIRTYREQALALDGRFTRNGSRYNITTGIRHFSLVHDDTSSYSTAGNYRLYDFSVKTTLTRHLPRDIDIFITPVAGWARQRRIFTASSAGFFDSTLYGQITPGAEWTIRDRGTLSARYTFSAVAVPADHDYRVAGGFASGISQMILFTGSVRAGKYFMFNGSYRGEIFGKQPGEPPRPADHVISLEVQAYLQ